MSCGMLNRIDGGEKECVFYIDLWHGHICFKELPESLRLKKKCKI